MKDSMSMFILIVVAIVAIASMIFTTQFPLSDSVGKASGDPIIKATLSANTNTVVKGSSVTFTLKVAGATPQSDPELDCGDGNKVSMEELDEGLGWRGICTYATAGTYGARAETTTDNAEVSVAIDSQSPETILYSNTINITVTNPDPTLDIYINGQNIENGGSSDPVDFNTTFEVAWESTGAYGCSAAASDPIPLLEPKHDNKTYFNQINNFNPTSSRELFARNQNTYKTPLKITLNCQGAIKTIYIPVNNITPPPNTFTARLTSDKNTTQIGSPINFNLKILTNQPYQYAGIALDCGNNYIVEMTDDDNDEEFAAACTYNTAKTYNAKAEITVISGPAEIPKYSNTKTITVTNPTTTNFTATLSGPDKVMQGIPVQYTVKLTGGKPPYYNIMLYCGDGTVVDLDPEEKDIGVVGSSRTTFSGQCRYAKTERGGYEVYAEAFDSKPSDPAQVGSNTIEVDVTSYRSNITPSVIVTTTKTSLKTGDAIDVSVRLTGLLTPYRMVKVHCGNQIFDMKPLTLNSYTAKCTYNSRGTYTVYAEIEDFIYRAIESDDLGVTVASRGGGSSSRDSSNGGGVYYVSNNTGGTCTPSWQCSEWKECVDNMQTRICTDAKSCNLLTGKPSETQTCVGTNPQGTEDNIEYIEPDQQSNPNENFETESSKSIFGAIWVYALFLIIIIIGVYLYLTWIVPERKKYNENIARMKKYVYLSRSRGYTDDKIEKALKSQGFDDKKIKSALK